MDVNNDIEPNLFSATYGVLGQAVDKAFGEVEWGQPNYEFVQALRQNVAVFSAFKTHSQQNELAALLTDDKGKLKSFRSFSKDSLPVIGKYNGAWLRTEYNTAVIRARFAARWKDFEADADLYPNLMWMPSTSVEPRQSHKDYYGKVWPMGDPFWNSHYPGNEWNCKCGITNTDQPPSHFAPAKPAPSMPGLDSNPATSAELIAPSHPLIKNAPKNARKAVDKFVHNELELDLHNIKKFKSGGVLEIPVHFNQTKAEANKNIKAYTELAKHHGEKYRLLSIKNTTGAKNPDALNLKTFKLSDAKNPVSKIGKNVIQNSIKDASSQNVEEVYIYLTAEYPMLDIWQGLKASLQNGRARSIEDIIIRMHDGEVKRYKTKKLREVFKKSKGSSS